MQWQELNPPPQKNLFIPKYMHQDFKVSLLECAHVFVQILVPTQDAKGNKLLWSCEELKTGNRRGELPRRQDEIRDSYELAREGDPTLPRFGDPSVLFDRVSPRESPRTRRRSAIDLPLSLAEREELRLLRQYARTPTLQNSSAVTDEWLASRAKQYRADLPPIKDYAYDPTCPYCSQFETRRALADCAQHPAPAGGAGYVRGPDGLEVVVGQTTAPGERLGSNELDSNSRVTVWQSESPAPAEQHTVIRVDQTLLECRPRTSGVHVSTVPDKEQWKSSYHHAGAMAIGSTQCLVAYSPAAPRTHIWIGGLALHIDELVNIFISNKSL